MFDEQVEVLGDLQWVTCQRNCFQYVAFNTLYHHTTTLQHTSSSTGEVTRVMSGKGGNLPPLPAF